MSEQTLQFTLRQCWHEVTRPKALVATLVIGFVIGLSGPFGTFETMQPAFRVFYWLLVALCTFCVGWMNALLIAVYSPLHKLGMFQSFAIAGLIGGIPIFLTVQLIALLLGIGSSSSWSELGILLIYCTAINVCICVMIAWFSSGDEQAEDKAAAVGTAPPALLKRLPIGSRGQLSHLSMQDHYVEVFTDKGSALVLMRLADAIAETRPLAGVQIHRSHWVALEGVASTRRARDRHIVVMKNGDELPISRSALARARDAGLLPGT